MITIIDYGMGNLGSVRNMFKRIGVESEITNDAEVISKATKLLLPGVGAFDAAMERVNSSGLLPVLNKRVLEDKVPVLGICLGMQLLSRRSEEGQLAGLGWLDAETIRLRAESIDLKIPHMGWNRVYPTVKNILTDDLPDEPRFYFVHSYHVRAADPANVLATTPYGIDFHSIVHQGNIFGAQFHPEKSHKFGMKLLANFAAIAYA